MLLGMISHKKSLIKFFGHKHFRQKFLQRFGSYLVSNCIFEAKLLQKLNINFEENDISDQKMLLLKYFKDYIILFVF